MIRKLFALLVFLALPGVAHADWYEASTPHFVVYSNDKPEWAKTFATQLERFDKALRYLRGLPDIPIGDANRVTVFVVPPPSRSLRETGTRRASIRPVRVNRWRSSRGFRATARCWI